MPLNRLVALATAALTLVLAVVPVIGNFDWTSTAGILAGIVALLGIVNRWLAGWSNYEVAAVHKDAAALNALAQGAEISGATEGVKAEGFTPSPES